MAIVYIECRMASSTPGMTFVVHPQLRWQWYDCCLLSLYAFVYFWACLLTVLTPTQWLSACTRHNKELIHSIDGCDMIGIESTPRKTLCSVKQYLMLAWKVHCANIFMKVLIYERAATIVFNETQHISYCFRATQSTQSTRISQVTLFHDDQICMKLQLH